MFRVVRLFAGGLTSPLRVAGPPTTNIIFHDNFINFPSTQRSHGDSEKCKMCAALHCRLLLSCIKSGRDVGVYMILRSAVNHIGSGAGARTGRELNHIGSKWKWISSQELKTLRNAYKVEK